MIKYAINAANRPIDESGNLIDISDKHLLVLDDYALLFSSESEKQKYIDSLPKPSWNKDAYCNELNEAHNAIFRKLYTERNYLSIGELSIYLSDKEYGIEASELVNWWKYTCKLVAAHCEEVVEETANLDKFIDSLPALN